MNSLSTNRQQFYLDGEPIEYWEDPNLPFRCTAEDLQGYVTRGDWVLLFNALTLLGSPVGAEWPRAPSAREGGSRLEPVRPRHGAEPARTGLRRPMLRGAIDGDQPERRAIAEHPLEVVEQAPVDVAAHVET